MSCTRLLTTTAILCSLLLTAVWALGDIMTKQYADAQMRGAMDAGNMMMAGSKNVTSSIDLMNIINQAIQSKVNVSLSEAITAAEGIGNNSHAAAVYLGEENGYLVYNIMLIDPSMNFSKVIVDPGNGHLLFGKQLSKEDMMKEEMGRHHKMMSMMMGGPQQGRGMMMGPMTAQAQQTDNITSSNVTSGLPTTNVTVNTTSPAAVVPTSEPSATTTVSMAQGSQFPNNPEFYIPTEVTVKPGQTVRWKNDDTAIHTATSGRNVIPDGKFDTSLVPPGQSSKPIAMPDQPGQYPYFCTLHPWMTGTVTVG